MRAVVLGSWGIGEAVLRGALETAGVEVAAVFTRPRDDSNTDPFRNLVADLAAAAKVPVFSSREASGRDGVRLLQDIAPDVVLSAAHPTLLTRDFLAVPPKGLLNLHGSLLPRNRGTSPVNWALIRDERETGLTMHYIDEGMDTGDVIFQERIQIDDDDYPSTLADRIRALAGPMIRRAMLDLLEGKSLPRRKQDDSAATFAPRLRAEDLVIDWNRPAREVWSFIRGTSQPNLGARAPIAGRNAIVWRAEIEHGGALAAPGTVTAHGDSFVVVACKDGAIRISHSAIDIVQ